MRALPGRVPVTSRTGWTVGIVAVVVAAGAFWWWRGGGSEAGARVPQGMASVQWRGTRRGSATIPAKVSWCPVNRTGVIEAISGDTGVAVVIYEENALTSGPHAVVAPLPATLAPRPAASLVMRWPADTAVLLGFTSQSGQVALQATAQRLSGTIQATMRGNLAGDSLTLTGRFVDLPVVTMAVGCP